MSFFNQGIYPTFWKTAKVTPVFKGGKRSECDNYRPISQSCSASRKSKSLPWIWSYKLMPNRSRSYSTAPVWLRQKLFYSVLHLHCSEQSTYVLDQGLTGCLVKWTLATPHRSKLVNSALFSLYLSDSTVRKRLKTFLKDKLIESNQGRKQRVVVDVGC